MKFYKNTDKDVHVFYGERGVGRKHCLIKLSISYILDEEYEKAKKTLDELQNLK